MTGGGLRKIEKIYTTNCKKTNLLERKDELTNVKIKHIKRMKMK